MSSNIITGNSNKIFFQCLEDLKSLLTRDIMKKLLAEVISIRISHQISKAVLYLLNDHIKIVHWSSFDKWLHMHRTLMSLECAHQISNKRNFHLRVILRLRQAIDWSFQLWWSLLKLCRWHTSYRAVYLFFNITIFWISNARLALFALTITVFSKEERSFVWCFLCLLFRIVIASCIRACL